MKNTFIHLFTLFLLSLALLSCNSDSSPSPPNQPPIPSDPTVDPDTFQISILSPSSDGHSLSAYSVISGECGKPGYPIEIQGPVNLYSICQENYKWVAPISALEASKGDITISVALREKDLTGGSALVNRTFSKIDDICEDETNKAKLFANIDTGANGTTVPYKICTPVQFSNIRFYPKANFEISQDINFQSATVRPISQIFEGELNGQGFTIENLLIKDLGGNDTSVGLFKYAKNAVIKNINIKDINVRGYQRVGVLAGDWRGTSLIENIKVSGSVEGITYIGGLIGIANSSAKVTIKNVKTHLEIKGKNYVAGAISLVNTSDGYVKIDDSKFYGNIESDSHTGGIIAKNVEPSTTLNNILVRGNILTNGAFAGGIFGESASVSAQNVFHIGHIESKLDAEDAYIAGLIGRVKGSANIQNSYHIGDIKSGGHHVGGLIARADSVSLNSSYTRGSILINDDKHNSVTKFVGGLVSHIKSDSTIIDSHSAMNIDANTTYAGGLVGFFGGINSVINNSYNIGNIKAKTAYIGGIVGQFNGRIIANSFSKGSLEIDAPTPLAYVGGICGYCDNATADYIKLYNKGNISFQNGTPDNIGGLFGLVKANSIENVFNTGNITNSRSKVGGIAGYLKSELNSAYSSGNIQANLRYVGGIAGVANNSTVANVFFTGEIEAAKEVGSIIGWQHGTSGSLEKAYALGVIKKKAGTSNSNLLFGAIYGKSDNPSSVINTYYKSNLSFIDLSDNSSFTANTSGTILTDGQLRNKIYLNNFDFTAKWIESPSDFRLPFTADNYLYPINRFLTEPNFGFNLPVVYTDDPASSPIPPLFIKEQTIISALSSEEISIIRSTDPVTTVTTGVLELSIINPHKNGLQISAQRLIYGECGIAGYPVKIEGDINLLTICQSNNKWAAIIDATNLPIGNITLNISTKNPNQTQSSPVMTRVLTKATNLCTDKLAMVGTFANSHLGADGDTTPYLICHSGHFKNISYFPNKKFELANDIDFSGNTISPIATVFSGSLDGRGFSVKNYIIDEPKKTNVALFSIINNATIKNITFDKFKVHGYSKVSGVAGTWAGTGEIQNVIAQGEVTGILYTGGVIGIANTNSSLNIEDLKTTTTVKGNNYTGGVIGHVLTDSGSFNATRIELHNDVKGQNYVGGFIGSTNEPNTIINTITQDKPIEALGHSLGGLIGSLKSANISLATISSPLLSKQMAKEGYVGGLVGNAITTLTLDTCQYNGTITAGADYIGGIAGYMEQGSINNNQSSGAINVNDTKYNSVRAFSGGIVGKINENSTMTNSSSNMTLTVESQFTGGLVGRFDGKQSVLTNSYFTGIVNARTAFIGGLSGLFDGATLEDSYSTAPVNVHNPTPDAYIGGLVGYANRTTSAYKNLYATGDVTITNGLADYVGGLVGYFRGGSLEDSYATGNVNGGRTANGGLVGFHRGLTKNSFATGDVNASFRQNGALIGFLLNGQVQESMSLGNVTSKAVAGGLVGYALGATTKIEKSYAFGTVTKANGSGYADSQFGPILGHSSEVNTVGPNNYYLTENYNNAHNAQGSAIALAQAQSANSYSGFSFSSTPGWRMPQTGFKLPGKVQDYNYPIPNFIGQGVVIAKYKIAGTIQGLNHSQATISLNNEEDIIVTAGSNNFEFTTQLFSSDAYNVTIKSQPTSPIMTCTIINGNGNVGNQDVQTIIFDCPTIESLELITDETNLAQGSNKQLEVRGTLSTGQFITLTDYANYSSSAPSNITVSAIGLLQAQAPGSSIISAVYAGKTKTQSFNVFTAPNSASNLSWDSPSPHNTQTVNLSWNKSTSSNILSQKINYYENQNCSGGESSQVVVASNVETLVKADLKNLTSYTYEVVSVDANGLEIASNCSSTLEVNLPLSAPVTNLKTAKVWVNGNLPLNSPLITWNLPSGISDIKISLGTSRGGSEVKDWSPIGQSSSHSFTGINSISECSAFYPSVKTVNQFGLESQIVTDTIGFRWDNTAPASVAAVTFSGDANITTTPTFAWQSTTDNCALRFYEMAIGTTPGGTEIADYKFIGNTTSYQAINGANGFNLNLQEGQNYYTSIRAVDYANNRSQITSSQSWQIQSVTANLPDLILWLDAAKKTSVIDRQGINADQVGFNNKVQLWNDISESTYSHNFYSSQNTSDPDYIASDKSIKFNGSAHYFITDNHDEINLSTVTQKNITLSVKTENNINNTQIIYEEGGTVRGMNIYISNGKLYCGFWNIPNDGDGAQPFLAVSTNIQKNSTYNITWNFDYSNYAGSAGPDGNLECIVNGQSIGQATTTTRIYPHSGGIGIAGMENDSFIHTGALSGNGYHFRGRLQEVMITNQAPSQSDITTIHNYLIGKWSGESLNSPTNLITLNNSKQDRSASLSWNAVAGNFNTDHYEYAIGTTQGGTEVLYWYSIGNVTSYQAISGQNGVNLNLDFDTDYYIAIKAVDTFGNESLVATSDVWQVKDLSSGLPDMILWLDSYDLSTLLDSNGKDAQDPQFNGYVSTWSDKSGSLNTHDFFEGNSPQYNYTSGHIDFDGQANYLAAANHDEINTATVSEKNISFAFKSSSDISTRQLIYEEGGGTRGMNIYIDNGKLYCGFWNQTDDGDGAQAFISVNTNIEINKNYYITWVLDYSNYSGPSGQDGNLDCYVNSVNIGSANTTTRIFPHGGAIGMGGANGSSRYHDGSTNGSHNFNGSIFEAMITNTTPSESTIHQLHNYMQDKWEN